MTMTAEEIVDRRRLRRKLSFWRVIAFIVLVLAICGGAYFAGGKNLSALSSDQIARVSISGFIAEDRDQLELFDKLSKEKSVKAVIVAINSGGGSTAGGEALYNAIRKLAAEKPTVATIGTVGASAAYMTAIATDHIVARRSAITGSIGVLFEYPDVSELLAKLGVKVEDIKSSPLKAAPNPFKPTTEEERAAVRALIDDTYRWFVGLVAERRQLNADQTRLVTDGRVFTGTQALAMKLIDEIGGEDEAKAWLEKSKDVPEKLPIKDWKPASRGGYFPLSDAAVGWVARQLGLAPEALRFLGLDRLLPRGSNLDGLVSVWQGSSDRRDGGGAPQ